MFVTVFVLALGKLVGEVLAGWSVLLIFMGASVAGALAYWLAWDTRWCCSAAIPGLRAGRLHLHPLGRARRQCHRAPGLYPHRLSRRHPARLRADRRRRLRLGGRSRGLRRGLRPRLPGEPRRLGGGQAAGPATVAGRRRFETPAYAISKSRLSRRFWRETAPRRRCDTRPRGRVQRGSAGCRAPLPAAGQVGPCRP
ncbi:MAG: hypothetical protein R3D59_09855 [Paracoccaceae bacterium]